LKRLSIITESGSYVHEPYVLILEWEHEQMRRLITKLAENTLRRKNCPEGGYCVEALIGDASRELIKKLKKGQ